MAARISDDSLDVEFLCCLCESYGNYGVFYHLLRLGDCLVIKVVKHLKSV